MTITLLPDQELAGHLFQHFDSRGGSYLLIGYETDQQAKEAYVKTAYEGMEDIHADLIQNLDDPNSDFEGAVRVFVWGAPITPDVVEALIDYGGKWHGVYCFDTKQVLFIRGDGQSTDPSYDPVEWFIRQIPTVKLVEAIGLGEDAFGCILVWNPNAGATA